MQLCCCGLCLSAHAVAVTQRHTSVAICKWDCLTKYCTKFFLSHSTHAAIVIRSLSPCTLMLAAGSDTGPECLPAASAMSFFEEGLAHNSVLKEYCLRYSSVAAVHFHDAVVQSKAETHHLTAVANMAVLCKLEADAAGNVDRMFRNDTFFSKAYLDRTFDCILDSLQRAVQVGTHAAQRTSQNSFTSYCHSRWPVAML